MIDEKKLIRDIRKFVEEHRNDEKINWTGLDWLLKEDSVVKIINDQPQANQWIPCSRELPDQRQYEDGEPIEFNVMLRYGVVSTTGCINKDGQWGEMCWAKAKFYPFMTDVIAWQPLSDPYKSEVTE